jgi:predicted enzyme related to lactoylglutathione lyase
MRAQPRNRSTSIEFNGGQMSTTDVSSGGTPRPQPGVMLMEVVVIPVSDVDRAKEFYDRLGWRVDADVAIGDLRLLQYTPPGSLCSIQFGTNLTPAAPGSFQSLYLVVPDIDAAREEIVGRGVEVSEVFHEGAIGARFSAAGSSGRVRGRAPEGATYGSFATFSDPDGNGWLLQEITTRLPGR